VPLSPSEWSPDTGMSYAAWLRGKNLQTRAGGWTHATHDQRREYVGKDGKRVKDTTDQLGNHVIQHGSDQQSVIASPQTVTAQIPVSALTRESPDVQQR
jgi:hypothetical protein